MPESINILGKSPNKLGNKYIKIYSVDVKKNNAFGDFIRTTRLSKGLSTTDVQERSRRGNQKGVSDGYVSMIENGHIKNVGGDILKALARALGITEEEIFAKARGASPDKTKVRDERAENLSLKFGKVPPTKQERAEALYKMLDRELDLLIEE